MTNLCLIAAVKTSPVGRDVAPFFLFPLPIEAFYTLLTPCPSLLWLCAVVPPNPIGRGLRTTRGLLLWGCWSGCRFLLICYFLHIWNYCCVISLLCLTEVLQLFKGQHLSGAPLDEFESHFKANDKTKTSHSLVWYVISKWQSTIPK